MNPGKNWSAVRSLRFVPLAAAIFVPLAALGQTSSNDAISREISLFNFGLPANSAEAISREVSLFNFGQSSASLEAISREVSIFNFGSPPTSTEAISREVSVYNFGQPSAGLEAVSREVSVFNFAQSSDSTEAISREVSVFNFGQSSANVEAISREVSVFNYGTPPLLFSVGSTNALKDEPNHVPFVLQTILDLTNLSLSLKTDDSRLQILGVTPVSPEVTSAAVGAENSSGYPIAFTLNPGALPPTNRVLAYLNFQGITNLDSAVVPLTITSLIATSAGGQMVPNITSDGQVIFIVTRPILFATNSPQFGITMFGVPGTTNAVEVTTNLPTANWYEIERLFVGDRMMTIPGLTTNAPRLFFRTRQVGP